ncbi:hypothetical protein JZ751_017371 [Albula glossodonta]|uniref:Protein phosphatase 1 regulatory subunit 15A/B C-terminal domain-containing protein n=1 Tax=Albula glossodonta TaxID=121402 RepID=A0A8T2PJT9_9TELE|nr:hypothetical protein JZ751_017371 [Albula glossodonta]
MSWRPCTGASAQQCRKNDSSGHCHQAESGTATGVAKPTELFEQCNDGGSVHSESAGPSYHKGQPDNCISKTARPESLLSEKPLLACQPFCEHLVSTRAATTCSEVAVLTPDQDNGYSSLEEEHSNSRTHIVEPPCPEQGYLEAGERAEELVCPTKGIMSGEASAQLSDEETREEGEGQADDSDLSDSEGEEEQEVRIPPSPQMPRCQNKAIAYIMGSPCSEESESEPGEDGDWDSEDDDGFDSEGSTDFSDSDDVDEEAEEEEGRESDAEEADAEVEQLWNSLCQSRDPYNPRNFTAALQTAPRPSTLTVEGAACAAQGEDDTLLEDPATPLSSPSSSPKPLVSEEESWEEASEVRFVEEVEEFYASSDEDRRGPWEEFARDRCRFLRRVQETEDAIGYCLAPTFRVLIFERLYQGC